MASRYGLIAILGIGDPRRSAIIIVISLVVVRSIIVIVRLFEIPISVKE